MPIRNPRRLDIGGPLPSAPQPAFPQPPVAPRLYRDIAVTFLGLTVVVIGVVVWMSSVRATVSVRVKRNVAKITSGVSIAKSPEQGELQGRVVEGTFDNIQEFKVKEQASSTPSVVMSVTKGRVRIVNNYSKPQTLVKTTRLLSPDGKLFRINATVTIPSRKTVDVDAYSDQSGKEYLLASGAKLTIPGLWIDLQKWIYAESITAFSGEGKTAKLVTAADLSEAQSTLQDAVVDQAKRTLVAEAGIPAEKLGDACTDESGCWNVVYFVKPIEKKSNVTAGQESDAFLAQVKVKVTAVFYPEKDMELFVRSKFKEQLPDGRELVDFSPSQVTYHLDEADASMERAKISFEAEAASRLTAQSTALSKDAIAGLSVAAAKDALTKIDGVESAEIRLQPSWASKVPSKKDAIELKIQ